MKNNLTFKLFYLCLSLLVITSCSSDDDQIENKAPNSFSLVSVSSGATDVNLKPTFIWQPAIDEDSENVSYDLYVDTSNPPTNIVQDNIATLDFTLQNDLNYNTEYYWKVVAKDSDGNTTSSSVSSFTTREGEIYEIIEGKWMYETLIYDDIDITDNCVTQSYMIFENTSEFNSDGEGENLFQYFYNGNCGTVVDDTFNYEFRDSYETLQIEYDNYYPNGYPEYTTFYFDIISINENELIIDNYYFGLITMQKVE